MHAPYRGHRIVPAATAPLDGFTQPAAAYSFRKIVSLYNGPAVKLRRTTGGTSDIGFVGSDFDTAAATTFCASTTCFIDTWYDQSGNNRHLVQATTTSQPQLIFNCNGTLPCAQTTTTAQNMAFTVTVGAGAAQSISAVGQHAVKPGGCGFLSVTVNQNIIYQHATLDLGIVQATTSINNPAPGLAWHSYVGVINGAASVNGVDGVEVAGTLTTVAGTGPLYFSPQAAGATCNNAEMVWWNGYALTPAERTALTNNQRNYWTPLPLDTFTTPAAAYSMRRLKSTYSGPGIRLRRASDSAELDIGFLGFTGFTGAPIDTAAANAHCTAATCFLSKWYDQSGSARDWTIAAASQPQYVADCGNGLPCAKTTGGQNLAFSTVTPAGAQSLAAVARVDGAIQGCTFLSASNNGLTSGAGTAQFGIAGTGNIFANAALATWHAANGVINGAASVLNVDGAETTGTVTTDVAAGNLYGVWGQGGTNLCSEREAVYWDGYALTAGERTALQTNQKNFWGTP